MKLQIPEEKSNTMVAALQPSRPILCTTKNADGTDHVAPFGWCTPISEQPPMLSLSILDHPRKSQSLQNIERTGEFVVNVPGADLIDAMVLSSYHTKFGENKFDRSGFTRLPSLKVAPVSIQECRASLECKVISISCPGDHALILADVVAVQYDSEAFTSNMRLDLRHSQPVIHISQFNSKEENCQFHLFMEPSRTSLVAEVMYPSKKEED